MQLSNFQHSSGLSYWECCLLAPPVYGRDSALEIQSAAVADWRH
ncbi:MAG: hypothetical protein P8X89_11980 [Reinekea sp.]